MGGVVSELLRADFYSLINGVLQSHRQRFGTDIGTPLSYFGTSTAARLIVPITVDILSNTIIPPNLTLHMVRPGAFSIATGCTLTVLGPMDPLPNHQIFQGPGTVSFGKNDTSNGGITSQGNSYVHFVLPTWWGSQPLTSINDITTDSTTAFQAALDTHKSLYVPEGFWAVKNLTMNGFAQAIFGDGFINTKVLCIATSGTAISINATDCAVYGFYLSGTLSGSSTNYCGIFQANGGTIYNMFVDHFDKGISVGSGGCFANNIIIDPCSTACMWLSGAQNSNVTNFIFGPASTADAIHMNNSCVQNYFQNGQLNAANPPSTATYGIRILSTSSENFFTNINIKNFGASGVYLDSTCNDNSFMHCQIRSNGKIDGTHYYGAEVLGKYNKVVACTAFDDAASQTQRYGVYLGVSSVSNIVTSNMLRQNLTGAFQDLGTTNVVSTNVTT